MLAVKKVIAALLVPPGLIILLLVGITLRELRRRNLFTGVAVMLTALLLWTASAAPVADRLLLGLERCYSLPVKPEGDVIILLGGGVHEGVTDLSGKSTPSRDMLARIVTAARLQKRLHLPVLITGGAVFDFQTAEAAVDARFLTDLGVPADKVILEEKSRDTLENAAYSAKICKARGFRRPILITSAYHMRRSVIAFTAAGLNVQPYPAQFQVWPEKKYRWMHYLPAAGALEQTAAALREYIGLTYYRLTVEPKSGKAKGAEGL